jgi:hypothetical protein
VGRSILGERRPVSKSLPHLRLTWVNSGGKERTRTLSGSVYATGSGSDLIESGSSFGKDINPETPLPIRPAMLAMDMILKPGEESCECLCLYVPLSFHSYYHIRLMIY